MKKITAALLALVMAVSFTACGGGSGSSGGTGGGTGSGGAPAASGNPQMTLKFAYDDVTSASYYKGLVRFKELVEENTNGDIQVEIYPDRQLGNAVDTIEGMKMGTVECVFASTAAMSGFAPEFAWVDAPFIFRDAAHARAVMDGEIGQELGKIALEKQGIRIMGFMDTGFRHIFSRKAAPTPADLKGLKIRTMESEIHVATFNAIGAIPSPMPSSEVYTGLSQGTIDAAENSYSFMINQKMYEVTDYVISSGHFYAFCSIMIAESVFQKMSADQQDIILAAAKECIEYQRKVMDEDNENAKAKLSELGVQVTDIDREALKAACQTVYADYASVLDPEIVARIEAVQ